MDDAWADPALEALLDYSKVCGKPHDKAYRSGTRMLVTDGCLLVRVAVKKPENLEALEEFKAQAQIEAWKYPIKLFRVDVSSLAKWANNEAPLIVECQNCENGKLEVDKDPDGDPIEPTIVDCHECDGGGVVEGPASYGWLTPKRLIDRRYVEIICAIAEEADVVDVRAQGHEPESGIRFRAQHWDAHLMPFRNGILPKGMDVAPPLWTPQPVLEGEHA